MRKVRDIGVVALLAATLTASVDPDRRTFVGDHTPEPRTSAARLPTRTEYATSNESLLPGAGRVVTETWQLKILSATVGTGEIAAFSTFYLGDPDPYLEIIDPNPGDNTVAVRSCRGRNDRRRVTPSTDGGLAVTGTNVMLISAIGIVALIAGAVLVLVARRRRIRTVTTD